MANPKHKQMDYRGMELIVDNVIFVQEDGTEVSLREVLADLAAPAVPEEPGV